MHLLSATIKGFKSFAGTFELRFDPGVTAIIGPNGSGKSNLAEAIRWVLGEQSTKQLRGKTSGDVIFAGSPKRRAASKAHVSLILSNESGRFPVEAAEVAIGRTVAQGGESEYTINGDAVRLLDIQHMLAEAGIGAKTYTVISQGTVDQYVTASPLARRQLFDEATGIRSLQMKFQEAGRKMERARQHMQELSLIKQELLPRLTVLEREVKRFEEKDELQKEYAEKLETYLHLHWHTAEQEITRLDEALKSLQAAVDVAEGERRRLEDILFTAAQESHDQEPSSLTQELAAAKQAYEVAMREYTNAQSRQKQLQTRLAAIREEKNKAQRVLLQKREELAQFDWLKQMRSLLTKTQDLLKALLKGNTPTTDEITHLDTAIARTLSVSDETLPVTAAKSLLHQIEEPVKEVSRLETLEAEYSSQYNLLQQTVQPSDTDVRRLQALVGKTRPLSEKSEINFDTLQEQLETARIKEMGTQQEMQAATTALQEAQQYRSRIEADIAREKGTGFIQTVQTTPPPKTACSKEELRRLSARLDVLSETDPLVMKEFEEVRARYNHVTVQLEDTTQSLENIAKLQENLSQHIKERFQERFTVISDAFGEYFERLFGGGKAALIQEADGIEITAQLPGKKSHHLHLLSGGEKTLTSLALLFAILRVQEPPFLVLDEVDAALDEANAQRFASLLQEKSKKTQCIVITHNRATMGHAHVLYGVTMSEPGVSSIYSVKLQDIQMAQETDTVQIQA